MGVNVRRQRRMASVIHTPLDVPVEIDAPFYVEREIALDASGRYGLFLVCDRRDASFERLRQLLGGAYGQKIEVNGMLHDANEPAGLLIPVHWLLQTRTVTAGEAESATLGAQLHSKAEVGRLLYVGDLAAGECKFMAQLGKGIPDFCGIRCRFRLDRLK